MSTAQLVVQHLPYLRRYARALTGSQMAGDAYVAATLETFCRYEQIAATDTWQVLARTNRSCGPPEPLATVSARAGDTSFRAREGSASGTEDR